jgi:RecA/RadA recombinase
MGNEEKPRRRRREPEAKPLHQQVEESATKKVEPRKIETDVLIPSGATLLNCACSDNPFGAYALGKIVTVPGASVSGKTVLCLTTFAEANLIKTLDDYDFIFDDVEEALEFDMDYLFGRATAERVKAPAYDGDIPVYSDTIQDLEGNVVRLCKGKEPRPFIYILDSLDALTSDEEVEREYKNALIRAKSAEHAEKIAQTYGTEKARIVGRVLRLIKKNLKETQSTLIIIQQERQRIGATFGKQWTTSGGKAPFYYSTHQVRLNRIATIKSKERKIGTSVTAEVIKNKLTGKEREASFKIYYDYGIDDVASCVDFLCKEHWKHPKEKGKEKTGSWIAEELDVTGAKATIIDHIEEQGLEKEMQKVVGEVWNEIEEELRLERKRKYD